METPTPAKRWNSFVCPACRSVFRVARDHDGRGVVCPSCRGMLRLPAEDAVPGPLLIPRGEEAEHVAEDQAVASDDEVRGMVRLLAAVSVPALLLLGGFAWWMMPKDHGPQGGIRVEPISPPAATGAETTGAGASAPAVALGVEIDTVTKNFLEAKTVEEMLRWVRLPEQTKPKVEKWLAGGTYKPPGLQGMRGQYLYSVDKGREVILVPVRIGGFEQRDLMLVREAEGLRADWEAWVAWSDMSLEQFRREKPQEAKAFRVLVSKSDYYNFHFKSEVEWSSYRLDSLDGEHSFFGYAPLGTALSPRLAGLLLSPSQKALLIRLKFPPDARTDNQVEIVELVSESWVDLSDVPPPP